jgi:hypothetical protein
MSLLYQACLINARNLGVDFDCNMSRPMSDPSLSISTLMKAKSSFSHRLFAILGYFGAVSITTCTAVNIAFSLIHIRLGYCNSLP